MTTKPVIKEKTKKLYVLCLNDPDDAEKWIELMNDPHKACKPINENWDAIGNYRVVLYVEEEK